MSSSFGQWYDDKRSEEGGGANSSSASWLGIDTESLMPTLDSEAMQNLSWSNMKASMEAQMPKKILGMGYQQRFQAFCALLFLSGLFFALAFFVGTPVMVARPQKFAISFTMGSLTFMGSFGLLVGPMEHLKGMLAPDRIYFTCIYVGSMLMTLYFTFTVGGASGYVLVMVASAAQLLALLYYLVSFIPGGAASLQYVLAAICQMLKPVLVACARLQAMCIAKCVALWFRNATSGE